MSESTDLTRFHLHVRSEELQYSVEAWNHSTEEWYPLDRTDADLYEVKRSAAFLDDRGEARLRITPSPDGVYLLGAYEEEEPETSRHWLRTHSLAYAEGSHAADEEIHLSHRSHDAGVTDRSEGHGRITLDGEVITEPFDLRVRGESASFDGTVFRDPWGNPIELDVAPAGDRLEVTATYTVEDPPDTWVDLRFVVPVPGAETVETLTFRGDGDDFTSQSIDGEFTTPLCQTPFTVTRGDDDAFVGVLDWELSNLFFRATDEGASVEYWAWPREETTYEWAFEVIPGYGFYANSFLRALDPHTADFEEAIDGNCAFPPATRTPEEAADAGIRTVWYHEVWFEQNGKYFDPAKPLDEPYETAAGETSSYQERIEDIQHAHDADIDVCMYTQFTGVSEPIVPEFESSLVRDFDDDTVVVGSDGNHDNIWVNPDPGLPYGQSFFEQVKGMLEVFDCDGISMDRVDRLDNRYDEGLFDLAHFDGSASPYLHEGEHRPCSSLARQGKRFWLEIRRILDEHDADFLVNLPRTPFLFRIADGIIADIHHSPWNLFFYRAMSNEMTYFLYNRSWESQKERGAVLLSQLVQTYAAVGSVWEEEETLYPAKVPQEHSRLLYTVPPADRTPGDEPEPRAWIFASGGATLSFDPDAGDSLPERYGGSVKFDEDGAKYRFPDEVEELVQPN